MAIGRLHGRHAMDTQVEFHVSGKVSINRKQEEKKTQIHAMTNVPECKSDEAEPRAPSWGEYCLTAEAIIVAPDAFDRVLCNKC